jgi:hypothetical protein
MLPWVLSRRHIQQCGGIGGGDMRSSVSPSAKMVYLENNGVIYPAMSMMVIGPSLLY